MTHIVRSESGVKTPDTYPPKTISQRAAAQVIRPERWQGKGSPPPVYNLQTEIDAVLAAGAYRIRYERLSAAVRDPRLDWGDVRVLACLCDHINGKLGTSWPSREKIALMEGLSVPSVQNSLYELKRYGYVVWEKRPNPSGKGRRLLQYTFPVRAMPPEHLLNEIAKAIVELRRKKLHRPQCTKTTSPAVEQEPIDRNQTVEGGAPYISRVTPSTAGAAATVAGLPRPPMSREVV